jgi:hypothetical protein
MGMSIMLAKFYISVYNKYFHHDRVSGSKSKDKRDVQEVETARQDR